MVDSTKNKESYQNYTIVIHGQEAPTKFWIKNAIVGAPPRYNINYDKVLLILPEKLYCDTIVILLKKQISTE